MTRWDAFTATCGFLRAGLLGGERPSQKDVAWELMIEVASFHYVAPALAWCLRDEPMPADVGEYFSSVAALSRQRNDRMLAGLARVGALLNGIGIEPVLLKGCAVLAEGLYPDVSMRLMGDADVLIPRERAAEAVAALTGAGFAIKESDVVVPPGHHHLQMLHDPETGLGVELHTDVISSAPDAVIATDWFCTDARPLTFRSHRVRVPEPTRNVGHCIFHSQIFHALHARNKIHLRHLLDLALLRARYEGAIDWTVLDRRFSAAGLGEALAAYLHFAEALFGQPAPALSHATQPGVLAELRRTESRNSFQVQIEGLKDALDVAQTELSRTMVKRDRLQAEMERLRAFGAEQQAKHAVLEAETEQLRMFGADLQAKYAALESETEQLRAFGADQQVKYAALESETEQLRAFGADQQAKYAVLGAETEQLRAFGANLQANRAALEAESEQLRVFGANLQARHAALRAQTEQLTASRAELEARHTALQAELAAVTRARATLEQDRARILASRSWRWTMPLRALIAASRRWTR